MSRIIRSAWFGTWHVDLGFLMNTVLRPRRLLVVPVIASAKLPITMRN